MNSQCLDSVASRISGRYAWESRENVKDGSLIGGLFEVLTAVRVNISCLVKQSLGLHLLWMAMGGHCWVDTLCTCRLANIVTMTWLLDDIALFNLRGAWASHFHLFVTDVVVVRICLHFVGLVTLAWNSWVVGCAWLATHLWRVLVSID